jgi:hypothetical protein
MRDFIYISWLNPIGGFEYWLFTGYKDLALDITETGQTKTNIFPGWPKSYGAAGSDTITKQTFRKTKKQRVIRSQILTGTQAQKMGEQIKSSPLVQIITTRRDRRTVLVDSDSFVVKKESNKVHTLSFVITYTDDYPNQHV